MKEKKLTLKSRAKTFYFASLFFRSELRKDIKILYKFCRYIDDIGDEKKVSTSHAKLKLQKISKELQNKKSNNTIIKNFFCIMQKYSIEASIPISLINGVKEDLKRVNFKKIDDLIIYSYKVAGTVGLMMCKIMKVKDKKLILKGIQLGIAMQITNVARDIKEDLLRERLYFPKNFLPFSFSNIREIIESRDLKKKFSKNIYKILEIGDKFYANAWNGVIELPLKYRIPIAIASDLYQSIGKKIEKKKFNVWENRIIISKFEKIFFTIQTVTKIIFNKKNSTNNKVEKELILLLRKFNFL